MQTNRNSTRRSLIVSAAALVLSLAMLVGTTYAWFTDTASSAVNVIQSGTLDLQLLNAQGEELTINDKLQWKKSSSAPDGEQILWEPGATYQTDGFQIKNNGDLALKFKLNIGTSTSDLKIVNAIDFYLTATPQQIPSGQQLLADVANNKAVLHLDDQPLSAGKYYAPGQLNGVDDSTTLYLVGHMKEEAGNQYQDASLDDIKLTVLATQQAEEYDSFNNTYDQNAQYAQPVATSEDLSAALANGQDVILTEPVTMPDAIEIKGNVTIYGSENGKLLAPDNNNRVINVNDNTEPVTLTLSNVDVVGPTTGTYTRGVSVYANTDVTIVVDNSSVSASYYAINIAGGNENVSVITKNATITGWCAFQTWSSGTKATFENCTLIGNNDKGYNADGWNDFATIVINTDATDTELTFNNCRFDANQTTGNKQYLLSVRASGAKITLNGCTYYANGQEIPNGDLGSYLNLYHSDLVLTIDGTVIPIG